MEHFIKTMYDLAGDVCEGVEDPLIGYAHLKRIEAAVKECLAAIQDDVLAEASKYEKTFEKHGCKFEQRNGARRWDFKGIPEWMDKITDLKAFEAKCKEAFSAMEKGLVVFNTEDGTEFPLPKVTHSKDSLTIKFLEDARH